MNMTGKERLSAKMRATYATWWGVWVRGSSFLTQSESVRVRVRVRVRVWVRVRVRVRLG